jgi:hypothetical protein
MNARRLVLAVLCATGASMLSGPQALAAEAPTIGEEWVTDVASGSATLTARIDPGGADTKYRFEYGTGAELKPVPEGEGDAGEGTEGVVVSVHVQGLLPETSYRFRAVATNSVTGVEGEERSFTTQPAGAGFALPDGRQYELVSPPEKDGAEILGIVGENASRVKGSPGGTAATQASEDGASVTYIASAPVGANSVGNHYSTQVFSTRGAGGWSSQDIATSQPNVSFEFGYGEEYRLFSADLSRALLQRAGASSEPSPAPEVHREVIGREDIFRRDSATGVFQTLLSEEEMTVHRLTTELMGATPDLAHVVFGTGPTYAGEVSELWEWSRRGTQLVSVLPGGEAATGFFPSERWHAISNDGTRVEWSSGSALFASDTATEKTATTEVDAVQGGGGSSGGGSFQVASSDGSRVFFSDSSELTSGASGGGLYMFGVADGKLTYIAAGANVIGADEAATSLYVTSPAVLTTTPNSREQVATEGQSNVYLLHEASAGSWSATFIATTEAGDPRVSRNGAYLTFMSQQSPTGYDNLDANSGQPDEEVYLYSAQANRLECASCNPTGARPVGVYDFGFEHFPSLTMDPTTAWTGHWLAALIPGFNENSVVRAGSGKDPLYQSRVLSDTGRLFFDSADALVPQDVNGREDVYEYEPEGVGSCAHAPGCVALISSGNGAEDSSFVDASASGADVFFTTQDQLAAEDRDSQSDMYDAHVCTAAEPCRSSAVSPSPCTTADQCRSAPAVQPGVFGAPASATFAGAGNPAPSSTTAVKPRQKTRTASQIRAEKLTKALRTCRRRYGSRRSARARCEAQARRNYGKAKTSGRRTK